MEMIKQDNIENKLKESHAKDKDQFVTVVSIGTETEKNYENVPFDNKNFNIETNSQNGFVTVLTIGDEIPDKDIYSNEILEEVLVYRLPGERLGFGLKFEGGTKTTEFVRRLFIQSCAADSPASRVKCSWGSLVEGDEILKIDSFSVRNMTRIDCVRCLKDSNVVIKLLVKHCTQRQEDIVADTIVPMNTDEDLSSEELIDKKRDPPPPPPIPPRKLSRKLLSKDKNILPTTIDIVDVDMQILSKTSSKLQTYPKSTPRSRQHLDLPPKVPSRDRKLSDVSSGPPDAEVYLDLLAQELECGIKTESESDDTGSTISTVIDKHNSIFLASNPSSIASDSIPSTPTAVQKQMDLSKVVNPFEMLEMEYGSNIQSNDDFLFTRFVSSHDILLEYEQSNNFDNKNPDCEKNSLTPPANFQDAPLSYGNEDVSTISKHNDRNPIIKITEPKENEDTTEEFEHRIVEEIKVPKPVPRKCYAKKKVAPEEILDSLGPIEDVDDTTIDFSLPRLVNFVPKIIPKSTPVSEMRYSFSDPDLQIKKEDSEYHNLCLMKYKNHSDDFNYLYSNSSNFIECNNNECDKIISCSSWSLHSQLATIGESEEELDSLENFKSGCNDEPDIAKPEEKILSEKEDNNHHPILISANLTDITGIQEPLHYAGDKKILINNSTNDLIISTQENSAMICEEEASNYDNEIPVIHLVQDGDESIKTDKNQKNSKLNKKTEISETMDVSSFIQSDQQHAITTSEYSSLSSLSSPPLSFSSRLPPDGQEFPPTCQEIQTRSEHPDTSHLAAAKCDPVTQMKDIHHVPSNNTNTPSWVKSPTDSREFNFTNSRSSLWKRDQPSAASVKDKIAIFSSAENLEPLLPLTKTYKSSENLTENKSNLYLYNKKEKFSKSCLCVNKIPNTQSENQNEIVSNISDNNNASHNNVENTKEKDIFDFTKPILNHTASFSTKPNLRQHNRSQSLLDMSSLDISWNNSDSRRLTLNTLIEQRRRGFSKLRGLVIPQTDVPITDPLLDLPEIHSKESNLLNQTTANRSKSESLESYNIGHQRNNFTSLQSPSWKNNTISNLPRYSPAFKRKCLQVYVMEQSSNGNISNNNCSPKTPDSVFQSDHETNTAVSLNSIPNDVFIKNSNFSEGQKVESPKLIASPSNSEISFEYSYQSTNSNNSIDTQNDNMYYANKSCQVPKAKNDLDRPEEDSDNDSAVSSSQSSYISRECSPLPLTLQDYTNNSHFIPSTDSNGNCKQNSIKSKDIFPNQNNNSLNSRLLKPQSVEAINRKNILASAKCRSGRDFKNGSPLIQRKLNDNEEEIITEEQDNVEKEELITEKESNSSTEIHVNNEKDDIDNKLNLSSTENISTNSLKSTECDNVRLCLETKKCDNIARTSDNFNKNCSLTAIATTAVKPMTSNIIEKVILRNTSKQNSTNVHLRHETVLPPTRKYYFDALDKPATIYIPISSRHDVSKRASVTDIRKQFEKFEQENQNSPTTPELKSPGFKSFTKSVFNRSPTTENIVENKISSSNATASKDIKNVPRSDVKSENNVMSVNTSPEELTQIVKELNEGVEKNSDLYVNQNEVIIVILHREIAGGSIGITLTGGTDYEAKEITVHKVLTGSCAHKDGRLKKGDRILAINSKKMLGLTHKESIDILKDPRPEVSLVVLPHKGKIISMATSIKKTNSQVLIIEENLSNQSITDNQPTNAKLIRVELIKDGAGLGFSLDGGKDSPKGDKPLIIKKIFTGGAAEKCGQLQAADELIEVNDVEVYKMTRIEVWSMMKKLPDGKVFLTIKR